MRALVITELLRHTPQAVLGRPYYSFFLVEHKKSLRIPYRKRQQMFSLLSPTSRGILRVEQLTLNICSFAFTLTDHLEISEIIFQTGVFKWLVTYQSLGWVIEMEAGKRIIEEWGNKFLFQKANDCQQFTLNTDKIYTLINVPIIKVRWEISGFKQKETRSDWILIWSHCWFSHGSCGEIRYIFYWPFTLRWGKRKERLRIWNYPH